MDASAKRALRDGAAMLGLNLDDRLLQSLSRYLDLLLLWNRRINLTAIREPGQIVEKHFLDSLAVAAHVPPNARTIMDVGSGAGFPGAVIALARPSLEVVLVEPSHKKAAFLQALRRELPCPLLLVVADRIEHVMTAPGFEPVDVAVSRATFELPRWLEIGRGLVKPGGIVLGMEGAEQYPLMVGCQRHSYSIPGAVRAVIVCSVGQIPT